MKDNYYKGSVISSRVRLARNLTEYPFPGKYDKTSAREVIDKVRAACDGSYAETDLEKASEIDAGALVEDHSISRDFAASDMPRALFTSPDRKVRIMVGEEDHLRIQCITDGFSLDEAYSLAAATDRELSSCLNYAFDPEFGYLTSCPTNLGTGMRASVMLFLPALTETDRIHSLSNQLAKMGVTIRGIYGEGSEALGCLYQISNTETMGVTETGVIAKLKDIIGKVIEIEIKLRTQLADNSRDVMIDRAMRALGTLRYAHIIDSSEFMKCYSDVRMGISLGFIKDVEFDKIDAAFIEAMPYTLMKHMGRSADSAERDLARAERIKQLI